MLEFHLKFGGNVEDCCVKTYDQRIIHATTMWACCHQHEAQQRGKTLHNEWPVTSGLQTREKSKEKRRNIRKKSHDKHKEPGQDRKFTLNFYVDVFRH